MKLKFLKLERLFIWEQLQIEEAILRTDTDNWCILNSGTPPAIVMGLSAVLDTVVHAKAAEQMPIIRRFSGGGTVVVDEGTFFSTLIIRDTDLPCERTPRHVMEWTGELYRPAFLPYQLQLEAHDYVLDGRKVGGNAQAFVKGGVLHHTSFLWSWKQERMALLKMPPQQPAYRQSRSHELFCAQLSSYFPSMQAVVNRLEEVFQSRFQLEEVRLEQARTLLMRPHRRQLALVGSSCK